MLQHIQISLATTCRQWYAGTNCRSVNTHVSLLCNKCRSLLAGPQGLRIGEDRNTHYGKRESRASWKPLIYALCMRETEIIRILNWFSWLSLLLVGSSNESLQECKVALAILLLWQGNKFAIMGCSNLILHITVWHAFFIACIQSEISVSN